MKMKTILTTIVVLFSCYASSYAASWELWFINQSDNNRFAYYFDTETLDVLPGSVELWMKIDSEIPANNDNIKIKIMREKYYKTKTRCNISIIAYDKNDKILNNINNRCRETQQIVPDSVGEHIWKLVFSQQFQLKHGYTAGKHYAPEESAHDGVIKQP